MSDSQPEALGLANCLLTAGIPVVVVTPKQNKEGEWYDSPQTGWSTITAEECDLSGFRPGVDALALVGGHGIDGVDEDTKVGGSIDHLPPFKHFGVTRTPSGGRHLIVPSSGLGKMTPLSTPGGHVGDYVGGRPDGSGRLLMYLPGSVRVKYPDGGYVEEEPWDVEACLAADPDPDLIEALENAGGSREERADRYVDGSPLRDPSLGPHPYAQKAVTEELKRLVQCEVEGWGSNWDDTTFAVACNLIEFGNSNWSGYELEVLHGMFLDLAPTDDGFGPSLHQYKWDSALNTTDGGGRPMPADRVGDPSEVFGVIEDAPSGILSKFPRVRMRDLLDPNKPAREYVVDPFIAAGTSVALIAPAGHRKSLLALALAVAVARGEETFAGMEIPKPRKVLYVDMENTEEDLAERLVSFGVTPTDDLENLILVSLPPMSPLDTKAGGAEFLQAVKAYDMQPGDVVVLDSYQRITEAGENESDTTREYYRHTGMGLKALRLTVIRTDNTGKDVKKGARGSSGKRDDVDVEYLIESEGSFLNVATGKTRQRGVGEMRLRVVVDETGMTRFLNDAPQRRNDEETKVAEVVKWLDEHAVDIDVSQRKSEDLLRDENGELRFPRAVIRQAVDRRKERADVFADDLS